MNLSTLSFTLTELRRVYLAGCPVRDVLEEARRRALDPRHPHVWITLLSAEQLAPYAAALEGRSPADLPLYGVPFAIKDNIDLAGVPTTCACPDFARIPAHSATVVERLIAAGAVPLGKTNMDQFATGLVGTRSPYGACESVFDPAYVSGGSSSGSAVAVAAGLTAFALGTDTAGSGRVPAAFNHLVGLKPTKGLVSTRGVFPACRSLDCVSIFAGCCGDAAAVLEVAAGWDEDEPYSRTGPLHGLPETFRFGLPAGELLQFFGDAEAESLFHAAAARLESVGGRRVEIDFQPFLDAAALLYAGPWVAERRHALGDFFVQHGASMDPVVQQIIGGASSYDSVAAFAGLYRLQELHAAARREWDKMDVLFLPTTGTTYSRAEVQREPVQLNSNLGYYTNFVNLLDLCAVAVPAGFRPSNRLPFGVTVMAPAFADRPLLALADRLHRALGGRLGMTSAEIAAQPAPGWPRDEIQLAVVGAHLSGQPLNRQLTSRGARLVRTTHSAREYRLYALARTTPAKPGLVRVAEPAGEGIELEIWALAPAAFASFVAEVPPPMAIGTATLLDGSTVKSFVCEPLALEGATDITHFGGWRAYLAAS